jgi:putative peptide zinc metalloprotease protein
VTISILFFLAKWLKPYKLETLSMLLAIGALASLVFWPAYRLVKGIRQRGRLPDMKRKRVIVSSVILAAILGAFLFLPLPVSRVREVGLVQVSEGYREAAHIAETGVLTEILVHDGQFVERGTDLAKLLNPQLEFERQQYEKEVTGGQALVAAIQQQLAAVRGDPAARAKLEPRLLEAQNALQNSRAQLEVRRRLIAETSVVKAPRAGIVMGAPKPDDLLRTWDRADGQPICTVGDPNRLRLVILVGAIDYREMRVNLDRQRVENPTDPHLEVSILPSRRSDRQFMGRITRLPDTDEKNVPLQLTHRGGGTWATKPGGDPNVHQPLVQAYLVPIEVEDPDATLAPGTLGTCKVHLKWRSAAWWTWRSVASALDVGLW